MTVQVDEATHCSGGSTAGARACLANWQRTTGHGSDGIYNCRPIRGKSSGFSVHAEGRAVDLHCVAGNPADLAIGDRYAAWLIANSDTLLVQRIIWNRHSWTSGGKWEPYDGVDPHTSHLHVEINRAGAANPSPLWGGKAATGAFTGAGYTGSGQAPLSLSGDPQTAATAASGGSGGIPLLDALTKPGTAGTPSLWLRIGSVLFGLVLLATGVWMVMPPAVHKAGHKLAAVAAL